MPEIICDGYCPFFAGGECELDLFPGQRPPRKCPRCRNTIEARKGPFD
ncbi:MAG TPA: hypothetical protein GX711_01895 [Clostridia bacterium]|nr:hypothetical protein [Clostridia bacterium]